MSSENVFFPEGMKGRAINPTTTIYFQSKPTRGIFRSLSALEIPRKSRNNQSFYADFTNVNSKIGKYFNRK